MKKIFTLTFIIFALFANAQSSLTIFNNSGQQFFVIINGIKQNSLPLTNCRVDNLSTEMAYEVKLIFADGKTGDISKKLWFEENGNYLARVDFKKKKGKLKYFGMTPTGQSTPEATPVIYRPNDQSVYSDQNISEPVNQSAINNSSSQNQSVNNQNSGGINNNNTVNQNVHTQEQINQNSQAVPSTAQTINPDGSITTTTVYQDGSVTQSTQLSTQNSGNNQDSQQISIGMPTVFSTYCDQSQSGPGFPGDLACQTAICASDAFCCNSFWDGICAGAASNEPACFYCLWSTNTSVVTGSTFLDLDCDGLFNNDDIIAANIPVQRNGQLMAVSNSIGEYSGLIEVNQNMLLSVDATAGFSINTHNVFSEEIETIHEIDFAFCPQGEVLNPGVTVSPVGLPPRPGFPVEYEVCVHNYSTTPAEVSVTFDFTNMLNTSVIDADSGIIGTSTINWNMIELGVFGSQCFSVTMQVQVGTPPGTILNPVVSVDAMPNPTADIDLSNNVHSFSHEVVAAYDPNDKVVDQPIVNFTEIEEGEGVELEYVIRFQNTGNFFATNVRVEDVLPELLDVNTIETIHASHDYELVIHPNSMVEWIFEDIMLPDSTTNEAESHGQIHFRITTVPDITLENVIENSASIYFDFKQPVVTEPAVTTFMDCSEGSLDVLGQLTVCSGELLILTANRTDFETYTWFINGEEVDGSEVEIIAPETSTNITLIAGHQVCELSTTVTLNVIEVPDIEIEVIEDMLVSSQNGFSYQWYFEGELLGWATNNSILPTENGTYQLVITFLSGCTASSEILYQSVGITDRMNEEIILAPNPARGMTQLILPDGQWSIALMSVSGKTITEYDYVNTKRFDLNLQSLAPGLYFVSIKSDRESFVKKLVVE